jgi:hypothetical protein
LVAHLHFTLEQRAVQAAVQDTAAAVAVLLLHLVKVLLAAMVELQAQVTLKAVAAAVQAL